MNSTSRPTVFAARGGGHRVYAGGKAPGKISSAKPRRDFVLDDSFAQRVGQSPFQSVSRRDPHFVVLREHQQERAIVPPPLANAPRLEEANSIIFDRCGRLLVRIDCDDNLVRRVAFELRQLAIQFLCGRRRNDTGEIVEVVRRRGRQRLGRAIQGGHHDRKTAAQHRPCRPRATISAPQ
jgi:hypothetical protein